MRRGSLVLSAAIVLCAAAAAHAQTGDDSLSPLAIAVACAPPPSYEAPAADALRIIGSQDVIPRSVFGNRDLLVIGGGSSAGVQLGQQFFIRRAITPPGSKENHGAKTLGWIRVVAVNDTTAIGIVDHVCGAIVSSDYLQPFVAPDVSAIANQGDAPGQPDFTTLGHILYGNEDRDAVGAGDFVLIDWGQNQGLTPGARFAIYRDMGVHGLPLASVGEGVVVSTAATTALTRVIRSVDAVYSGDYIALRK
jgi:hypothetical protein